MKINIDHNVNHCSVRIRKIEELDFRKLNVPLNYLACIMKTKYLVMILLKYKNTIGFTSSSLRRSHFS